MLAAMNGWCARYCSILMLKYTSEPFVLFNVNSALVRIGKVNEYRKLWILNVNASDYLKKEKESSTC
ncbi:hypothetical protein B566_EDAN000847 [Ephemera danica]|nr:hypothetical protein B566_EDAN000847 [Ephemera danica]